MFLGCEPVNSSLYVPPAAHTCHPWLVASLASPLPSQGTLHKAEAGEALGRARVSEGVTSCGQK